jgi:hypothetical protein
MAFQTASAFPLGLGPFLFALLRSQMQKLHDSDIRKEAWKMKEAAK